MWSKERGVWSPSKVYEIYKRVPLWCTDGFNRQSKFAVRVLPSLDCSMTELSSRIQRLLQNDDSESFSNRLYTIATVGDAMCTRFTVIYWSEHSIGALSFTLQLFLIRIPFTESDCLRLQVEKAWRGKWYHRSIKHMLYNTSAESSQLISSLRLPKVTSLTTTQEANNITLF